MPRPGAPFFSRRDSPDHRPYSEVSLETSADLSCGDTAPIGSYAVLDFCLFVLAGEGSGEVNSLIQINANDAQSKGGMRKGIRIQLDELAALREKAALLCEETKGLIEDYRRLKKWQDELISMLSTEVIPPARQCLAQPVGKPIVGAEVN